MEIRDGRAGPEMRIGKTAQREAGLKNPIPVTVEEMLRLEVLSLVHFDEYENMWEAGEPASKRGPVAVRALAEQRVADRIKNYLHENDAIALEEAL